MRQTTTPRANPLSSLPSSRAPGGRPPSTARPRSIHWLAWAAAVASIGIAAVWMWAAPADNLITLLQGADVGLALFFAVEFFTRTGWQRSRAAYLKWRWFDFIALVPVTVLGPLAIPLVFWLVLACRAIRLIDRTLGDGFVQRNALVLVGAVEEEISDRVLEKMLARWEHELHDAKFGAAMAQALARNKEAVLRRVFAEQLQDGTFAKIAHFTGLQAALEQEERRLFSAVIEMVGSHEVDEAIRDVVATSLSRTRQQLGTRDWRRNFGAATRIADERPPTASPAASST